MKRAGINMVRTGVWTAYRQVMFIDGRPDEGRHARIPGHGPHRLQARYAAGVLLFAFTPEQWEGVNCYLDPDCLRAQKRYIAAFLDRAENCGLVSWDLINEPSVCNPQRLWSSRQTAMPLNWRPGGNTCAGYMAQPNGCRSAGM